MEEGMTIYRLGAVAPAISDSAYVAPGATVIGRVRLGERASVWFGAVLRGDNEPIAVGAESNVQEGAVLHPDPGFPLTVGARVTVGHQAMLHGCTIGDGTLVGIQAVVMNGAVIGRDCLIGAGTIVTERKAFPDRSLILGVPARALRTLTDAEVATLQASADTYVKRAARYRNELHPASEPDWIPPGGK
jgi:carbonic anhydrase/acetyltransferase-like protein (isoleucine patch superfamily)